MPATSDHRETLSIAGRHTIFSHFGPFIALTLVFLFFGVADSLRNGERSVFLTPRNLQTVAIQTSPTIVAGLGMTLIIIAGGIDLSAGTAIALCATVLAQRLEAGSDPLLALGCSILCGVLVGAINGTLVSRLRVVPFIITLGTMTVSLGVAKILAREMTIRPPLETIPDWLTNLLSTSQSLFGYLPAGVWIAMILSISLALLLRWTVFGRHLYAIGSNEAAARLCGINVSLVKILLYSLAGLFIGIAGIYQFSKITSGSPTSGIGMELRIIAAVVIGGASLQGGRGTVLGTICGAFIMSIISNGCTHLNVSNPLQDIILGLIVITAVSVDQWRQVRRN